jgi:predicted AlkP superfamily pyrophosphatase or phosphodiesterase
MKHSRRFSLIAALLLIFFAACNAPAQTSPEQAPPKTSSQRTQAESKRPKLVLVIVVDQFRYDYLLRFRDDYTGGIARLLNGGAVFHDAHYLQYPTVTAVGHSTILSGATPSVSGIIGNEWLDRASNESVTSVSDKSTTLLGSNAGTGSSPQRLLVSTLGDELKMAGRNSRVIGISIKDRSAILPSGHMADAAYWFDDKAGHFVSSTYYMKELPNWVSQINAGEPASKYATAEWHALNSKADDKPFCSMKPESGVRPCSSLENTPFGNEILVNFAEEAVDHENLGRHDATDLLTVSFSANDYVGHGLGPDSPEVRDISIRTDRMLGDLLSFVFQRVGQQNTLVVFTADHGVAPVPKVNNDRKMPGGWLQAAEYSAKIGDALSAKFGQGKWFSFDTSGFLYLNDETVAANKADRAEVRRFAADFARGLPRIARVLTRDDLLRGDESSDLVGRAMLLGFYGPRSGDLELLPEPYYMFSSPPGTTHSTPYSYDNHVPVIFMGRGIKAGAYLNRVAVNDIAPTLAEILQIETPSGSSGRVLVEMLQ